MSLIDNRKEVITLDIPRNISEITGYRKPDHRDTLFIDGITISMSGYKIGLLDEDEKLIHEFDIDSSSPDSIQISKENSKKQIKYIITDDPIALYKADIIISYYEIEAGVVTNEMLTNDSKPSTKIVDVKIINSKDDTINSIIISDSNNNNIQLGLGNKRIKEYALAADEKIYSTTKVDDKIIISTNKDIYVFTLAVTNDAAESDRELFFVIDTIEKVSYNPTYQEIVNNGLNILMKDPLKILKTDSDLNLYNFNVSDIVLTDNNSELILMPRPNKEMVANSQIEFPNKWLKDTTADRTGITYAWELKEYDKTTGTWTDVSTKLSDTTTATTTISALGKSAEYELTLTATITPGSLPKETSVKTIYFETTTDVAPDTSEASSILDNIKRCKYIDNFDGKLVFYGNETTEIYTSNIINPFYFTSSNIATADSFGKSENIIAIKTFKDTKIIFTNSTMMSMSEVEVGGLKVWGILPLDGVVGAVGHNAVTEVENTISFVDRNGIYLIEQISVAEKRVQLNKISYSINDLALPYIDLTNKNNEELMSDIYAHSLEERIFFSYPSKDKNFTLVYDYGVSGIQKGKWTKWTGLVPKLITSFDNILYALPSTTNVNIGFKKNKIYSKQPKDNSRTFSKNYPTGFFADDRVLYDFKYESHNSDLGTTWTSKKIKSITLEIENNIDHTPKLEVETFTDYQLNWKYDADFSTTDSSATNAFTSKWSKIQTGNIRETVNSTKRFMKSKSGEVFQIVLINKRDEAVKINSIEVEAAEGRTNRRKIRR